MNNFFRALIAGYGAKKLGGGCFSTILVFIVIWVLLGQCGAALPPPDLPTPDPITLHVDAPPPGYTATASPIASGIADW